MGTYKILIQQITIFYVVWALDHVFVAQSMCLSMLRGTAGPNLGGYPEPSHGQVFCEKFRSVYAQKFGNTWRNE